MTTMAELGGSRPGGGLSLSAENLAALEPAPLDDLVESEVIVGDDSDDEFAFNGEVKDSEEIYVQNGPRGPSMTLGHVTIEHSYCTPDDEPPVKLVDPDRFSDFFLMEEPPAAGHVQLFSDMRQCLAGGGVSYMQVTSAVLSSLTQGGRRLESLTEEDETEAAAEDAADERPLPDVRRADADASPATAAAPPPPVGAGAADGTVMAAARPDAADMRLWGAGVGVLPTVPETGQEGAETPKHGGGTGDGVGEEKTVEETGVTEAAAATQPASEPTPAELALMTASVTSATEGSPTDLSRSLGPVSGSEPLPTMSESVTGMSESVTEMSQSVSLVSPVEPATEISGPVSLVGIVLPSAEAQTSHHEPHSDAALWAPPDAAAAAAAPLPVLKIDEGVDLKSEPDSASAAGSSDRSTPPRVGKDAAGKRPTSRPPARASPRGTISARAKADLAKARSSSATREEKRTMSSYGTLPRRKEKKPLPGEAAKKDELAPVSEIARKRELPAKPAAKPATSAAGVKRKPLDNKKVSELKKSDSSPDAASTGTLGRKKPATADSAELKRSADKYGTLTRRKKEKPAAEGAAAATTSATTKSATFTAEELKRGADAFGTLGRRKKTAPPRQEGATKPAAAPSSRPGSASSAPGTGSSKAASPRQPASLGATGAARRPGVAPARPGAARPTGRTAAGATKSRERTLICLETACQTVLTGGELGAASLRPRPAVDRLEAACQAEIAGPQQAQQAAELARLQAETERARQALDQLNQLQMELSAARRQLQEEQADKTEVQDELERTTSRVRDMMARMETVEQELQQHQDSLLRTEQRAQTAETAAEKLQHELDLSQAAAHRLSQDLEKSVAAQKTLLQQVQETEAESCELHEFMQLEKNALVDALRDAESEMANLRQASAASDKVIREKEEQCDQMERLAEERAEEMLALKADLQHVQSRTKELLLCQGAGVSGASVALSELTARLETALRALLPAHLLRDLELPHATSVPARLAAEAAPPPRRAASLVSALAAPPRSVSQMVRALDLPAGATLLADERLPLSGGDSLQELAVRHLLEGRDSPEGQESCERAEDAAGAGLDEQVQQVDRLVDRLIRAAATVGRKAAAEQTERPSSSASGSCDQEELQKRLAQLEAENAELRSCQQRPRTPDNETMSLRQELAKKDRQLDELKQKYNKHKQILTENVQKAESEIQTLDEIIDYVIASLGSVPEVVQQQSVLWKLWLDLDGPNKTIAKSKLNGTTPISDLNANADIVKV